MQNNWMYFDVTVHEKQAALSPVCLPLDGLHQLQDKFQCHGVGSQMNDRQLEMQGNPFETDGIHVSQHQNWLCQSFFWHILVVLGWQHHQRCNEYVLKGVKKNEEITCP
jgi:hypothetical protein